MASKLNKYALPEDADAPRDAAASAVDAASNNNAAASASGAADPPEPSSLLSSTPGTGFPRHSEASTPEIDIELQFQSSDASLIPSARHPPPTTGPRATPASSLPTPAPPAVSTVHILPPISPLSFPNPLLDEFTRPAKTGSLKPVLSEDEVPSPPAFDPVADDENAGEDENGDYEEEDEWAEVRLSSETGATSTFTITSTTPASSTRVTRRRRGTDAETRCCHVNDAGPHRRGDAPDAGLLRFSDALTIFRTSLGFSITDDPGLEHVPCCPALPCFPASPAHQPVARRFLVALAATSFSDSDPSHLNVLKSVYRRLQPQEPMPRRFGVHWESIGFQGSDPATDLRGVGMLAPLCLLHWFIDRSGSAVVDAIFRLSLDSVQGFPLAATSVNVTRFCLQALKAGAIDGILKRGEKHCSPQTPLGEPGVDAFCRLYRAAFRSLYLSWRDQDMTILQAGFALKELEKRVRKQPRKLMKEFEGVGEGKGRREEERERKREMVKSKKSKSKSEEEPMATFTNLDEL